VFELTKASIPHIHIFTSDKSCDIKIENILNKYSNRTQLLKVKDTLEDRMRVANYLTKMINEDKKLYLGFENILKSLKLKLFTSSNAKTFAKSQRRVLFTSYQLHRQYATSIYSFASQDFMGFIFNFVKNPKTNHNIHLKSNTPHFIINGDRVHHSTNLRVMSKYTRIDRKEKRKIEKTHKSIISFSTLIINNSTIEQVRFIYKIIISTNLYIVIYLTINRIIIIKPPP
jgi:hypothetical protein